MSNTPPATRRPLFAFLAAIPIALLGGLIGLGGAEFRLPVLAGPLRYAAKQAVPLNLAISLVTLATSLASRAGSMDMAALGALAPAILAMIAGALVTAFLGPTLASRISNASLERVILVLLVVIGTALIVESFLQTETAGQVPAAAWPVAAFILGLAIGLVSSLLGVAGGEFDHSVLRLRVWRPDQDRRHCQPAGEPADRQRRDPALLAPGRLR